MKLLAGKGKGFTLIEAAVILLLLSVALVPVVKMVAAKAGNNSGFSVATSGYMSKQLSEEQALAFSIMEKAIANDATIVRPLVGKYSGTTYRKLSFSDSDFVYLNPDGSYCSSPANYRPEVADPSWVTGSPNSSVYDHAKRTFTYPKYRYGTTKFYYQWELQDSAMQKVWADSSHSASVYKSFMPKGNNLIKAVLRIYGGEDAATTSKVDYSISTYFYANTGEAVGNDATFEDKIGIVLALDVSGSMKFGNVVAHTTEVNIDARIPDWVPTSITLWTNDDATGVPLPLRLSSAIADYDRFAVASPYLTYRQGINDLFFGSKPLDNGVTPYDERYNPCFESDSSYTSTDKMVSTSYRYPVTAATTTGTPAAQLDETDCDLNHNIGTGNDGSGAAALQALPSTDSAYSVFVKLPTVNEHSIATATAFETSCTNVADLKTTDCNVMVSDGSNYNDYDYKVALDVSSTKIYQSDLLSSNGNDAIMKNTLSRIEAERTAVLAFVEMIEANTGLVNNFRLGFVPFSTEVIDNTYDVSSVALGPDETVVLQKPVSGKFTSLRDKFFRINRACNFSYDSKTTSQYAAACPGGLKPITANGATNIAQGLFRANTILQGHKASTGEDLAKKLVILLTDGEPNYGVDTTTGNAYDCDPFSDCKSNLRAVADMLAAGEVSIYTIGLLTAGNANADAALGEIQAASAPFEPTVKNQTIKVDSVGDLTPVFESIAQQAEQMVLEQMKKRYSYLDYNMY